MDILQVLGGLVKPKRQYTKLEDKQCAVCGEWFHPKTAKTKCCSLECSQKLCGQKSTDRSVEKTTHVCANCGKQYRAKRYDRVSFCGRACAAEYKRKQGEEGERKRAEQKSAERAAKRRTCLRCGCEFKPKASEQYCSDECRKARNSAKGREQYAQRRGSLAQAVCKCCGVTFEPQRGNGAMFCSRRCAKRYGNREKSRTFNGRGRAALREHYGDEWRKHYERINQAKVHERDGYVCGICGGAIDRYEKSPVPTSPSVDHIVPLSKGGDHTYSNVRSAHFWCNSKRGAGRQV